MSPIEIGRSDHRKMILNPEMRFSHMSALKCDRPLCQMNTELCKLSSLKLAALDIGDDLQVPTYLVSQPLTAPQALVSVLNSETNIPLHQRTWSVRKHQSPYLFLQVDICFQGRWYKCPSTGWLLTFTSTNTPSGLASATQMTSRGEPAYALSDHTKSRPRYVEHFRAATRQMPRDHVSTNNFSKENKIKHYVLRAD